MSIFKPYFTYIAVILTVGLCISCHREPVQHFEGVAFGTTYHITYLGKWSEDLPKQVDSVLANINNTFSIFDTNSLISSINNGKTRQVNDDFKHLLELSLTIHQQTNGAFECTIQPLVELWGFGRGNQKQVVAQSQIDSVKQFVGCEKVTLMDHELQLKDSRIQFNFNAIAKGYAVDKVAQFLKQQGFVNHLVEIGGEVVAGGTKNGKLWKIGIQTPTETADGAVDSNESFELRDRAVATSGNYRNYFEENGHRYTHIMNPVTGKPEETNLLSVTVIAPTCATADAYATAFMVLGLDRSSEIVRQHPELKAWFIYSDGKEFKSIQAK